MSENDNQATLDVQDYFDGKVSLQDLLGFSANDVDGLLALGSMLYSQGRWAEAEDVFRALVLINKDNAIAQSALGTVLTAENKPDEALVVLNEALRLDNTDIASYVNRADVLIKKEEFEKALGDLKQAMDLDPSGTNPAINRARAMIQGMAETLKQAQETESESKEA
jgi:tetratricopeptide (TPR) repeat protein